MKNMLETVRDLRFGPKFAYEEAHIHNGFEQALEELRIQTAADSLGPFVVNAGRRPRHMQDDYIHQVSVRVLDIISPELDGHELELDPQQTFWLSTRVHETWAGESPRELVNKPRLYFRYKATD